LKIDGSPGLGLDERSKIRRGHHISLARFAVFSGGSTGELREQPHATERNAGSETRGWFSDKTSAAWAQNAKDFIENSLAVSNDQK
jgi:hypothetical protein